MPSFNVQHLPRWRSDVTFIPGSCPFGLWEVLIILPKAAEGGGSSVPRTSPSSECHPPQSCLPVCTSLCLSIVRSQWSASWDAPSVREVQIMGEAFGTIKHLILYSLVNEQHLLDVKCPGRLWGQGCIWWTAGAAPNCRLECLHAALHVPSLFVWRPPPLHGRLLSKCLVHPAQAKTHPKESWAAEQHVSFHQYRHFSNSTTNKAPEFSTFPMHSALGLNLD